MEAKIQIDTTVITPGIAHEINRFWSEWEWRLEDADGDVYKAIAKLAGAACMGIALEDSWAREPHLIQREFDKQEGWPGVGIKLLSIQGVPELNRDWMECVEVAA
jgi:hypothetical protein